MKEELDKILDKTMPSMGRAADLFWIVFGKDILVEDYKGNKVEKNEYAIHIQCPWRLLKDNNLILGSRDIYIPKEGIEESEFDYESFGMSLFDEKVKGIESELLPLHVESISTDSTGGFKIVFNHCFVLEVMPDSSAEIEFWRFIDFNTRKHYVLFEEDWSLED